MNILKTSSKLTATVLLSVAAVGVLFATVTFAPREAAAKPEFAQQTGLPCGQCHVNPAGSGALKPFGAKFKANGFKVK
jgi:hypothetical protein